MDNPIPIPQNRLQSMLSGARALMDKVENTNFNTDEYQASIAERRAELQSGTQIKMLNENEVSQMGGTPQYENQQPQQHTGDQAMMQQQFNQQFNQQYGQQMQAPQQYQPQQAMTNDRIANSKLPDNIKEAMAKNPIPQANSMVGGTFSLSDVQDLLPQQGQPQQGQPQQIQEGVPQQRMTGGMTEREVRNIIREEVLDMMAKYFGGTLNEDLEKQLLQKLIKEGKIKTVPKKRTVAKKN